MSDYISREAAMEIVKRTSGDYAAAFSEIRKLPAADAEPVWRGRWISLTDCSNAGVYCSICHKKVYKEDYAWCNRKNKVRSPYCPNCGSKMDLEDETNDN